MRVTRRDLLLLFGAAALYWPRKGRAQQSGHSRVVGYLSSKDANAETSIVAGVRKGLAKNGFTEGKKLVIDFAWSNGDYNRLPTLAADLINRNVDLLMTSGLPATVAAQKATTKIPIVFRLAIDPIAFGLAESLGRPGGNITGVTMLFDPLTPKKLELLRELVPGADPVGFLLNPKNQNAASHRERAEAATKNLGIKLTILRASVVADIGTAFAAARQQGVAALLVGDDPFFDVSRDKLVATANRFGLPTMFYVRDFTDAGGLISYGPNFNEMALQAGDYAGRILNGVNPADLPIGQPTKFELVINLKTAKALGITVPQLLLAQADEVIE